MNWKKVLVEVLKFAIAILVGAGGGAVGVQMLSSCKNPTNYQGVSLTTTQQTFVSVTAGGVNVPFRPTASLRSSKEWNTAFVLRSSSSDVTSKSIKETTSPQSSTLGLRLQKTKLRPTLSSSLTKWRLTLTRPLNTMTRKQCSTSWMQWSRWNADALLAVKS